MLAVAVLCVIQAFALWVVVFPRSVNMHLWTMLVTCQLAPLQKPGSSYSTFLKGKTLATGRKSSSPSPAASPTNSLVNVVDL